MLDQIHQTHGQIQGLETGYYPLPVIITSTGPGVHLNIVALVLFIVSTIVVFVAERRLSKNPLLAFDQAELEVPFYQEPRDELE